MWLLKNWQHNGCVANKRGELCVFYYVSGVPIGDELYHHGIKGQKWGVRRFENPDGTLTAAGKARYAIYRTGQTLGKAARAVGRAGKATGRAVGKAGKAVAKHEIDKIKRKHLWMMSDQELRNYTERLAIENAYKQAIKTNRYSRGKELAKNILEKGATTLANKALEGMANRYMENQNIKMEEKKFKREERRKAISENNAAARKLANDRLYSSVMSRQNTRNEIRSNNMREKEAREREKGYKSTKLYDDIIKRSSYLSPNSMERLVNRADTIRNIENRYRSSGNNNQGGGKGNNNNNGGNGSSKKKKKGGGNP